MRILSFIHRIGFLRGEGEVNWVITTSRRFVLVSIGLCVLLLLWRYSTLPPLVPLWYNKPWGADRLAHPMWLWILPIGNFVILTVNTVTGRILPRELLVFNQMLALTSLLVAVLTLVTLAKILFLVS